MNSQTQVLPESKDATKRPLHRFVRRFVVSGHAFVPVKVRIEIEAADAEAAMKSANKKLKTKIRDHIVAGSDDEGAAWGFDATDAEEIISPNEPRSDAL